jgi:hypothetical protein
MRINVYGEEITDKIEIVKKAVDQRLFLAIRVYLESSKKLHHSIGDNDESAISFWVPWTKEKGNDIERVARIFENMAHLLRTQIK